jgi:ABC-type Mn2+/Zn2+ transport system permease subunit
VGRLFWAILVTAVVCIPLGLSLWALLDCAKRPQWAWALAGRRQVVWLVAILFGFASVIGGLLVSGWYLLRVRPVVAAAEHGVFEG